MQTPEWVRSTVAGQAYCERGQHFVPNGAQVWRCFVTPLVSRGCVCDECAQSTTEEESHA